MADVETTPALLIMALQDLFDGERALVERLPKVANASRDEALTAFLTADRARSQTQQERLAAALRDQGETPGDSENIWLRAILDDADNDAHTIAAGPLRDIALVGALRKGKQSERVSYETALALAAHLDRTELAAALRQSRDEEQAADDALAELLRRLVEQAKPG